MNNEVRASLGFKGDRGYSAYEIAVRNGYVGSEQTWLASLGESSHLERQSTVYTTEEVNESSFELPVEYTSNSYVEVFVNGFKLNSNEYSIDINDNEVDLVTPLEVVGTKVEIIVTTMTTTNLPISDTITSTSTNDTAAGSKAVYDSLQDILNSINIQTIYFEVELRSGGIRIQSSSYPAGFDKENTVVIGKKIRISGTGTYFDDYLANDIPVGVFGEHPVIPIIELNRDNIVTYIKNNLSTTILAEVILTLLKVGE